MVGFTESTLGNGFSRKIHGEKKMQATCLNSKGGYLYLKLGLLLFIVTIGSAHPAQTQTASPQPQSKLRIDPKTSEGKLLGAIGQEGDPARKQALMEDFQAKYPKSPGLPWVAGQLQGLFISQGQFDRSLALGEAALAVDPNQLDISYKNLKAGEGKKDPDLVKKWASQTSAIARKLLSDGKMPPDEADYARQVDIYTEYSLYSTALLLLNPFKTIELVDILERQNAKSQYLSKVYGKYFNALRQIGQSERAGMQAERVAAADPGCEDALLIAAEYNLQKKNEPAKVIGYANQLTKLMETKTKPEGMADADWAKKKDQLEGLAFWMAGIAYSDGSQFEEADKSLRLALPHLKDDQVTAVALFHLGTSNYKIAKARKDKARMQEALRFSELSASTKGPVQSQAQQNVKAIRAELAAK